jgi:hypothetical protein
LFYRDCAQLFIHELLRLRNGRDCLRNMVLRLHGNLNWQTTFLQAFQDHFHRLIDADKWYSVSAVNIGGRDRMSVWPLETSRRQLDEILTTRVQVRLAAEELPIRTAVPLQRILSEWDFARQQPVLLEKLQQLQALGLRAAPESIPLVEGYAKVIQAYAVGRDPKTSSSRLASAARRAIKDLDKLDARRHRLGEP